MEYRNIRLAIWDMGGKDEVRGMWRHYCRNSQGIIFVVDSEDRRRMEEAKDELGKMLGVDEVKGVPVLVLANKQDLKDAMDTKEVTEKLGWNHVKDREWFIQAISATSVRDL